MAPKASLNGKQPRSLNSIKRKNDDKRVAAHFALQLLVFLRLHFQSMAISDRVVQSIRVANPSRRRGRAGLNCRECQDFFWAAFQAAGVNSATRLLGQSPSLGSTLVR